VTPLIYCGAQALGRASLKAEREWIIVCGLQLDAAEWCNVYIVSITNEDFCVEN
jgi:hypothetical protein